MDNIWGVSPEIRVSLNYSGHVSNGVLDFCLFGIMDIFNFCIIKSIFNLVNHFDEFLDPENIAFDTTMIAIVWIIREFCCFSFETVAILDFIIN
jgi:hypothetical protein